MMMERPLTRNPSTVGEIHQRLVHRPRDELTSCAISSCVRSCGTFNASTGFAEA